MGCQNWTTPTTIANDPGRKVEVRPDACVCPRQSPGTEPVLPAGQRFQPFLNSTNYPVRARAVTNAEKISRQIALAHAAIGLSPQCGVHEHWHMPRSLCAARPSGRDVPNHRQTSLKYKQKWGLWPHTPSTRRRTKEGAARRAQPQETAAQHVATLIGAAGRPATRPYLQSRTLRATTQYLSVTTVDKKICTRGDNANLDSTASLVESTSTPSLPNHHHFPENASRGVRQTPETERTVRPALLTSSRTG